MKKLYQILKAALWCLGGLVAGAGAYRYWHYRTHPEWYAWQSAPWYTGVALLAALAAVLALALLAALYLVRRKSR